MSRSQIKRAKYKVWVGRHDGALMQYLRDVRGWRMIMVLHSLFCGYGYALLDERFVSTPSLAYVRGFGVPIGAWGILLGLLALGLLDWRREVYRWAYLGLGLFWLFWTACLFATTIDGTTTGWGGPAHVAVISLLHLRLSVFRKTK